MQSSRIGILVFPLLFLLGIGCMFAFRYIQVRQIPPFAPQPPALTLLPPTVALTGTLIETSGTVKHLTREAEEYQEATPGGTIFQGESLATQQGTARVNMGEIGSVILDEDTEISFINFIPGQLVFRQRSGSATYENNTLTPISIRTGDALITLRGDGKILMTTARITLSVVKGTATIGVVDENNETHAYSVIGGETAHIHSDQSVTIQ